MCPARQVFASEAYLAHFLKLALVAVGDFLLNELEEGLWRAFCEGLHEAMGVVVDEAAKSGHDYVSQGVIHEVFHGMVAQRLQKADHSYCLLEGVVLKRETSQEDDQLTAEATQLGSLLKILFSVF